MLLFFFFFFFNDTATTEIYTLSLHDALPICPVPSGDPSSTMRTSSRGSCSSTCSTSVGMLIASLYVGMTTSARSGTRASPLPGWRYKEAGNDHQQAHRPDHFSPCEGA